PCRHLACQQPLAALGAAVLWEQSGYRDAPTPQGTARTSNGFIDGIMNPRTAELMDAGVWTGGAHRDTHLVVRRMRILPEFMSQPVPDQERAIGRERASGAPLSGGGPDDEVDLFAKTADGRLLTPKASHARRAHPSNIGRALMLRRSYSFDVPEGAGLLFIAFMSDPQTFVLTQRRLDEMDDLIAHTVTDASGCFFVPGDQEDPHSA
ncbi:MAG TPA: Dyp-type peroxidase, partial [Microbacterium sp.]|nr:Dyp-type peroxidase [Microbacterium sp.]